MSYPFSLITGLNEIESKKFLVDFNDGKNLSFSTVNEIAYEAVKKLEAEKRA